MEKIFVSCFVFSVLFLSSVFIYLGLGTYEGSKTS